MGKAQQVMSKRQTNNQNPPTRRNYGIDDFDSEELSLIFQIAEKSIVTWPIELEDEFDMSLNDLGNLKVRISKFLDEDIY